jgi:hypothetical protein
MENKITLKNNSTLELNKTNIISWLAFDNTVKELLLSKKITIHTISFELQEKMQSIGYDKNNSEQMSLYTELEHQEIEKNQNSLATLIFAILKEFEIYKPLLRCLEKSKFNDELITEKILENVEFQESLVEIISFVIAKLYEGVKKKDLNS